MCVLPVFIPRQEDKGIANPSGVHLRLKQSLRRTIASMYCSLGSCTKKIDVGDEESAEAKEIHDSTTLKGVRLG